MVFILNCIFIFHHCAGSGHGPSPSSARPSRTRRARRRCTLSSPASPRPRLTAPSSAATRRDAASGTTSWRPTTRPGSCSTRCSATAPARSSRTAPAWPSNRSSRACPSCWCRTWWVVNQSFFSLLNNFFGTFLSFPLQHNLDLYNLTWPDLT